MTSKIKKQLALNDEILEDIINKIDLPKIENTQNVFHDLMSCIIEQQIHYRSTKNIFQKRMEAANLEILTVENFEKLEKDGFKNLKLSTNKYETILRVVDFFEKNNIDWEKNDDVEVRKILSKIKGVGTWTIDMILMYTLERADIFPADDYHLKLIMTKLYPIDESARVKAQQKAIAENWAPYKSFGVKYLLAYKEALKKGIL